MLKKLFKRGKPETSAQPKSAPVARNAQQHEKKKGNKSRKQPQAHAAPRQSHKNSAPKKVHPADTPWSLSEFQVEVAEGKTRFHDLQLPDSVMRGIHALGFQYCSPIQAESLPAALTGRDTIGQAQTGTGKTAAFLLTIMNRLLTASPEERFASEPPALGVAPT
uniref:DEAD/DEAH box helicase n=1 Tax=uncultured Thalassolituus sp. TaxID=285273 RepID=UPI0026398EDF